MKKSELRQLIREEISKVLNEGNTGLITFDQAKQACAEKYKEYTQIDFSEEALGGVDEEIMEAKNMDQLVDVLDGLGFNGDEAYEFIFDAILK
jgi:hypothetical protein